MNESNVMESRNLRILFSQDSRPYLTVFQQDHSHFKEGSCCFQGEGSKEGECFEACWDSEKRALSLMLASRKRCERARGSLGKSEEISSLRKEAR